MQVAEDPENRVYTVVDMKTRIGVPARRIYDINCMLLPLGALDKIDVSTYRFFGYSRLETACMSIWEQCNGDPMYWIDPQASQTKRGRLSEQIFLPEGSFARPKGSFARQNNSSLQEEEEEFRSIQEDERSSLRDEDYCEKSFQRPSRGSEGGIHANGTGPASLALKYLVARLLSGCALCVTHRPSFIRSLVKDAFTKDSAIVRRMYDVVNVLKETGFFETPFITAIVKRIAARSYTAPRLPSQAIPDEEEEETGKRKRRDDTSFRDNVSRRDEQSSLLEDLPDLASSAGETFGEESPVYESTQRERCSTLNDEPGLVDTDHRIQWPDAETMPDLLSVEELMCLLG